MRKAFAAALLLTLVAVNASTLNIKELLATIAMPLAVAAVSHVNGVPQTALANLVTTLNQANVPPPRSPTSPAFRRINWRTSWPR